jgi:hypothetical protein
MYRITQRSGFQADILDDRNERPLTTAFAAIVMVWSMAFALTFASAHFGPQAARWSESPTVTSAIAR